MHGLQPDLSSISLLSKAKSRSLSAENPTGKKGGGGREPVYIDPETGKPSGPAAELGLGWKIRPSVMIKPGETYTLADISGPGCIQSMWMVPAGVPNRDLILRMYWDDQEHPSVEVPFGDFFASAYANCTSPFFEGYKFAQINSATVVVNPGSSFNCYWPMPFRKNCRMTLENRDVENQCHFYYQVNYALDEVPEDCAYFHAQFRRTNPLPYGKVYTILDGVRGQGQYVGTYMAWGLNNNNWWGEGEIKFYMDGDIPEGKSVDEAVAEHGGDCFPTICGTGTEDYFLGSYNFENKTTKQYQEYSTLYSGVPMVVRPDGVYQANTRFSMYRWQIPDPVRFEKDLAITIQALGWRSRWRYLPLQDDIASTAFWYQTLPTAPFPELGSPNDLEII